MQSQASTLLTVTNQIKLKHSQTFCPLNLSIVLTRALRKRKLTLESMAWLLVGMAIYNDKSMADIVNMLDIVDRTGKHLWLQAH